MPREATITYEQIEAIAAAIQAEGSALGGGRFVSV